MDDQRRFRTLVSRFEGLRDQAKEPFDLRAWFKKGESEALRQTRIKLSNDPRIGIALLHDILSTTPIYDDGEFSGSVEYTSADLQDFGRISGRLQSFVAALFEVQTQRDVFEKPIQHFGKLLRLVGLRHKQVRSEKVGDEKIRYYSLVPGDLNLMSAIATDRSESGAWQSLNKRHGFKYSQEDVDWLLRHSR